MSYQNRNNQSYNGQSGGYSDGSDYGRRYRNDSGSGYDSRYDQSYDNSFDVNPSSSRQSYSRDYDGNQKGYGGGNRQRYQQDYDGYQQGSRSRSRQQYPQNYDGYRQVYDDRGSRQRRDPYYDRKASYDDYYDDRYDDRQRYRSREAYGDSYDDRSRGYERSRQRGYNDRYDDRRYSGRKPQKKRSGGAFTVVIVIAVIALVIGLGIVGFKIYEYETAKKNHSELQALAGNYEELYARNNDFFGWIKIEDTVINYPVMYSPDEPQRYLHMNFDGGYSESGELFMDGSCDPNGYHYLIYGHHMNNGTMFGSLPKYGEEDYYNEHKTIRFDTRTENGEYEVFAVFYSQVFDESEDVFKYYEYANLDNESDFSYFVGQVKSMSIYDTGITPVYGDKILTLSTCNYHTEDGRFVVCAKKVE